jgi:hypothetical protein
VSPFVSENFEDLKASLTRRLRKYILSHCVRNFVFADWIRVCRTRIRRLAAHKLGNYCSVSPLSLIFGALCIVHSGKEVALLASMGADQSTCTNERVVPRVALGGVQPRA